MSFETVGSLHQTIRDELLTVVYKTEVYGKDMCQVCSTHRLRFFCSVKISSSAFFISTTPGKIFFARFNSVSEIRQESNVFELSTFVALINPCLHAPCAVKKSRPNIFPTSKILWAA
jgi:hypothetical protein